MPAELVARITEIVHREGYPALVRAFPQDQGAPITLTENEAEALIELAVIEKKRARLKYPRFDPDLPDHSPADEAAFDDVQMGFYEKVLASLDGAFPGNQFDHLL